MSFRSRPVECCNVHVSKSNSNTSYKTSSLYYYSLQHLDVHRNRLTSLPKELEELQQLTYLDASHNCIRTYPGRVYKLSE